MIFQCAAILLVSATLASAAPNLVLAIGGEPEAGFDPLTGWGDYGNPLFQSTLLRRGPDMETLPDLALDWHLSADRRVWTITLREALFSDGTALTAADVAYTFNAAKAAAGAADMHPMQQAEALDPRTVRIKLDRPWITFAETFYTLGIVPAQAHGAGYGRAPVGSGPYRMVSWAEGEQLIVAPNPHYYGPAAPFGQITFLFTGPDAGLAAANAGVAHVVAVPAQLADAVPAGFHAQNVRTVDSRGLSMPFRPDLNPVTADPAIRRAMNLGLDRDLLVDVALNGHGTPAFGPVDGLPWAGAHDRAAFDPDAAAALLDAAGWATGPDGIRARGGLRAAFALNYPAGDATRQALAEVTAELLRPLGIEARPKGGSWHAIDRVMATEPVIFGFGSHSPWQLYALFAARLGGTGYMNPSHYENPAVEALFDTAQSAAGIDSSYPFWAQAADHYGIAGDNAWVWLVNLDHVYLVDDCLDLGRTQIEPHAHGWPVIATIADWRWTCE